jgi:hypothetical protein
MLSFSFRQFSALQIPEIFSILQIASRALFTFLFFLPRGASNGIVATAANHGYYIQLLVGAREAGRVFREVATTPTSAMKLTNPFWGETYVVSDSVLILIVEMQLTVCLVQWILLKASCSFSSGHRPKRRKIKYLSTHSHPSFPTATVD